MLDTLKGAAIGMAVLVAGVIAWQVGRNGKTIAQGVTAAVNAVNPFSSENVVYQAASSVSQAITGSTAPTLGGQIADVLQPDPIQLWNNAEQARYQAAVRQADAQSRNNTELTGILRRNPLLIQQLQSRAQRDGLPQLLEW